MTMIIRPRVAQILHQDPVGALVLAERYPNAKVSKAILEQWDLGVMLGGGDGLGVLPGGAVLTHRTMFAICRLNGSVSVEIMGTDYQEEAETPVKALVALSSKLWAKWKALREKNRSDLMGADSDEFCSLSNIFSQCDRSNYRDHTTLLGRLTSTTEVEPMVVSGPEAYPLHEYDEVIDEAVGDLVWFKVPQNTITGNLTDGYADILEHLHLKLRKKN